jgi:hypothetical protein
LDFIFFSRFTVYSIYVIYLALLCPFQLEHGNNIRLSKEVADKSQQLRYIISFYRIIFPYVLLILIPFIFDNRQARGEDLQGLNLEELLQLEKKLEAGLRRVIDSKVCTRLLISYLYVTITCWALTYMCAPAHVLNLNIYRKRCKINLNGLHLYRISPFGLNFIE